MEREIRVNCNGVMYKSFWVTKTWFLSYEVQWLEKSFDCEPLNHIQEVHSSNPPPGTRHNHINISNLVRSWIKSLNKMKYLNKVKVNRQSLWFDCLERHFEKLILIRSKSCRYAYANVVICFSETTMHHQKC